MAGNRKSKSGLISTNQTVAENKRARFDYFIEEKFEAGIALTGTEVKSLRMGQCSINESYVGPKGSEIYLYGAHIAEYSQASAHLQHNPRRNRKLLLKRREIDKLLGSVSREGYTIVPIRIYFNATGLAKIEIGLAKGKKQHDKRETIKERDWNKQKARILRDKN